MVISAGMKSLVAATVIVLLAAKSVAVETSLCTEVTVDGQAVVPDQNGYYNYQMVFDERRPFLYLVFNLTVHPQNDDGSQSFSLQSSDSYLKGYLENISNAAYIVCNVNDGQTCQLSYNFTEIISAAPTPSVIDQLFIISDALRLCYLNIETRAEADPVTLNLEWVHPMDTETFFQLKTTTSGYPRPITIDNELKCDGVVVEAQVLPKDAGFVIGADALRGYQTCRVTARSTQDSVTKVLDVPALPDLSLEPEPPDDKIWILAVVVGVVFFISGLCFYFFSVRKFKNSVTVNNYMPKEGRHSPSGGIDRIQPTNAPPRPVPESSSDQEYGRYSSGNGQEDEEHSVDGVHETNAETPAVIQPSRDDSHPCRTFVSDMNSGRSNINNVKDVKATLCSDNFIDQPGGEQKPQILDEALTE